MKLFCEQITLVTVCTKLFSFKQLHGVFPIRIFTYPIPELFSEISHQLQSINHANIFRRNFMRQMHLWRFISIFTQPRERKER